MLLKKSLVFGLTFSLLQACKSVPPHEICIIDPPSVGAWCARTDKPQDEATFRPLGEMENYISRSPEDEKMLIEWLKDKCD